MRLQDLSPRPSPLRGRGFLWPFPEAEKGGTPPAISWHGGEAPLHPRFSPPSFAEGSPGFRAPSWLGCRSCLLAPLIGFSGGTPPQTPGKGLRPLHPRFFPALVCSGFAGVKGPPRRRGCGSCPFAPNLSPLESKEKAGGTAPYAPIFPPVGGVRKGVRLPRFPQ